MNKKTTFNVFDLFVTEGDRFKNSNEKGFKFINRLKRHINSLKDGTGSRKLKSSNSNIEEIEKIEHFMKDFLLVDKSIKSMKIKGLRRACICNVISATEISRIIDSISESGDNFIKSFLYSEQLVPFFLFENCYVSSILNQLQYEMCRMQMFYNEYSCIENRLSALDTILYEQEVLEHFGLSRDSRVTDIKKRFNEIISEEDAKFGNEYKTVLQEILKLDVIQKTNLNMRDLKAWCVIESNALDSILGWIDDAQKAIDCRYQIAQEKVDETDCYEDLYEFFLTELMNGISVLPEQKEESERILSLMEIGLELIDGNEFDRH